MSADLFMLDTSAVLTLIEDEAGAGRVEALPLAALAAGDPAVLFGSTPLLSDSLLPD